ncbi:MAG: phosphoribosylamine--glycine ligase [Bacteroidia bacterium]|nr:phosphoribosylamine--glycine ligase [Bacteroidia bacterium]MDW8088943.1 phosphoribosylamine--glycine ligase [Bacteroidia bacterium]
MTRVLVVGRGAREHAIAHKALRSPRLKVFVAPGNAAMRPPIQRVPIEEKDIAGLRQFIRTERIDYVIVGPEAPIARGMYDDLHDLATVVAPPQRLSFLESSKARAKAFMKQHGIPTPEAVVFESAQLEAALDYLRRCTYPVVVKASGLAQGKGVLIAYTPEEALSFARACLSGEKFGAAGQTILVEKFLEGEERSVFLLADGKGYALLPTVRDYKRREEKDQGPNTGGMGSYAPAEDLAWLETIRHKVIEPTWAGIQALGRAYTGFLYIGLMKTAEGPYVLEYNIRLGDPEAQVLLPLLENDLEEVLYYYKIQKLTELKIRLHANYAVGVVAATAGYPEKPTQGQLLPEPPAAEGGCLVEADSYIYWAGVDQNAQGQWVTTGGRTYTAVGLGPDLEAARARAYAILDKFPFEGRIYRKDIAQR